MRLLPRTAPWRVTLCPGGGGGALLPPAIRTDPWMESADDPSQHATA
jgi:hypothetical protein